MADDCNQVPGEHSVPSAERARRSRFRTFLLACVRSRYTAAVIIAFAISYAFHVAEQRTDARIKQQADLTHCVIVNTAKQQELIGDATRVNLRRVLANCENQVYKR